jgi:hypothetical protein
VKRTRSDLELPFLSLCDRHGLPRPLVNVRVHGRLVDFFWPEQQLVVETDSWEYHRGSVGFEDDHDDQLEAAPQAVATDLRRALVPAS